MRYLSRAGAAVALAAGLLSGTAVSAGCYDVFGCSDRTLFRVSDLRNGPNCEFLWTMRNEIYKERGYCFRTARAVSAFGNDGCQYQDQNAVPLNRFERANVGAIGQVEREMSCPR